MTLSDGFFVRIEGVMIGVTLTFAYHLDLRGAIFFFGAFGFFALSNAVSRKPAQ